ncbi:Pycsar system effector family protein [uncultured Brevundimonas sp.]|uniref:Pycsar system effector family protein n=1 Tax=uncultured Brevundimonas sp. TaxID=213418 RepID=UPI0025F5AC1E|nr:Pycsar system effector family protein [uncultured Brevundimonas sp.]
MIKDAAILEANLRDQLTRTSDWLKFAETKNAALLTFSSAWLLAMGNLAYGSMSATEHVRVAIAWAAPFVFIAGTLAIVSILPGIPFFRKKSPGPNLLFYDNIRSNSGKLLRDNVRARYVDGDTHSDAYLEDLATQVAINSQIASRKFRLFRWGASSTLLSIGVFFTFAYGSFLFGFVIRLFH